MSAPARFLFLIIALVLFILLALIGGGVFSDAAPNPDVLWALLGGGLASWVIASLGPWPR